MIAETAANRKMMDNVYTYDKVSNILNLKNNAPIPTSNLMGSQTDYSFVYDDLYRLTSATGSNKGSNHEDMYTLKMAYNSVHGIVKKEQLHQFKSPNATNWSPRNKTTYTYNYSYTYDANGNQTGWDYNNSGQQRQILWDEENRIKAIEDNGALFSYVYDAGGERVLKSNGGGAQVSVNGSPKGGNGSIGNYTVYVNPYVVIRNGGTTKHFYIESQRIATKILESKDGLLQNVTTTSTAPAGNRTVDYAKKQKLLENDFNLILAKVDGEAGNSGNTPPNGNAYGWGNGNNGGTNNGNGNNGGNNGGGNNGNGGGNTGGGTTPTGGGSNGNNIEKFVFYYHPDHLGSSSYITDVNGEVSQHIEYFAFGETFVEEHSNTDRTPYLYNAKELDEETGLYYYGARYYDPKTSVWASTDPLAEKYPSISPYAYVANNPINFIDPDGRDILPVLLRNISGKGMALREEYRSYAPVVKAMSDFGKTTYGKQFIGNFLEKGTQQYGVEGTGKYAKYTLEIKQFDLPEGTYQYNYMQGAEGYFNAMEVNGKLHIVMGLDARDKNPQSLGETITHELALHGYKVDEIIKAYEKGGMEAVNKLMPNDRGNSDHNALKNNSQNHQGVKKYNETKNELIEVNPKYKQEFEKAKKE